MAKFTLSIECDNSAFQSDDPLFEVARILGEISRKLGDDSESTGLIFDANGNRCGKWEYA